MKRYIDVDKLMADLAKEEWYMFSKPELISGLRDYPTANVKPIRHGHWVEDTELRCSVCGQKALRNYYYDVQSYSDFCPHCGADMRG